MEPPAPLRAHGGALIRVPARLKESLPAYVAAVLLAILPLAVATLVFPPKNRKPLNASIQYSGHVFRVTNLDTCDWLNVTVEVRTGHDSWNLYRFGVTRVPAGGSVLIRPEDLFDRQHRALDRTRERPRGFFLECGVPYGSVSWNGDW